MWSLKSLTPGTGEGVIVPETRDGIEEEGEKLYSLVFCWSLLTAFVKYGGKGIL